MEHIPTAWLTEAATPPRSRAGQSAAHRAGRDVVGCVLTAWFLLRGYKRTTDERCRRSA